MGSVTDWRGQERLAALAELSLQAGLIGDPRRVIGRASPSLRHILGDDLDDLVDTPVRNRVAPEDARLRAFRGSGQHRLWAEAVGLSNQRVPQRMGQPVSAATRE
jgi:hypothetical protein